jgi:hypothetical protein
MATDGRLLGRGRRRVGRVQARRERAISDLEIPLGAPRLKAIRKGRPRRRFDLSLPSHLGAEIRLPALPTIHIGPRLLSSSLLAALGTVLVMLLRAPVMQVGQAEVFEAKIMPAELVRSIAAVDRESVFLVDPPAIVAALEAHPEIASARVRVHWPNRVQITLQERQPVAEWEDDGRTWWISSEGIGYLKHGDWPGVIRITSKKPFLQIQADPLVPVVSGELLRSAAVLAAQINGLDSLVFHPDHGLGYADERGWTAYFGTSGDMVMKSRLYEAVAGSLLAQGIAASLVSVEDPAVPYLIQ